MKGRRTIDASDRAAVVGAARTRNNGRYNGNGRGWATPPEVFDPWTGHRVFMNPPYGREVYAWTRKAVLEAAAGATVVGLLPASTDLAWWHEDVLGHAEILRWYRGRVRFLTGGPYRASGFFPSVAVVWRPGTHA